MRCRHDHFGDDPTVDDRLARIGIDENEMGPVSDWFVTTCFACNRSALWLRTKLVRPTNRQGAKPDPAMPPDVRELYDEARLVAAHSPRAASMLLRVALERLVNGLVNDNARLNDKIGTLVKRGLSKDVQRAMDAMRVFANDGAHAGQLDPTDTAARAARLFSVINIIVRQVIVEPAEVEDLWSQLPQGARAQVQNRDDAAS